jgi:hypothetical protein
MLGGFWQLFGIRIFDFMMLSARKIPYIILREADITHDCPDGTKKPPRGAEFFCV